MSWHNNTKNDPWVYRPVFVVVFFLSKEEEKKLETSQAFFLGGGVGGGFSATKYFCISTDSNCFYCYMLSFNVWC